MEVLHRELERLAKQRMEEGEKKYKGEWKKLNKKELLKMIDEELADIVNYLFFCKKKKFLNKEEHIRLLLLVNGTYVDIHNIME